MTATRHTGNRYGRSEDARQAVLFAADDLVVELGFAAVTVEGIAKAAGVSKQTIYRWWDSKTAILLDVLVDYADPDLAPRDLGDLRADLVDHAEQIATFLFRSDEGAVYRALVGQALIDPAAATALREVFEEPQRSRDLLPFARARERGEVALPDDEVVLDRVLGPLYYRALTGRAAPNDGAITAWVDSALTPE